MASQKNLSWCVYLIRFEASEKLYVGSTTEWPKRAKSHLYELERGMHCNVHLQRAYNAYGDQGVSVWVLEDIDSSMGEYYLRLREEFWIIVFRAADKSRGYNIAPTPTEGTLGTKRTPEQKKKMSKFQQDWLANPANQIGIEARRKRARANGFGVPKTYVLYNPQGKRVEITNLKAFSRENGLVYSRMHMVTRGLAPQHQGWKLSLDRGHKKQRTFRLQSPDGEIIEGANLFGFCRERGLMPTAMYNLINGKRQAACGGWRLPEL